MSDDRVETFHEPTPWWEVLWGNGPVIFDDGEVGIAAVALRGADGLLYITNDPSNPSRVLTLPSDAMVTGVFARRVARINAAQAVQGSYTILTPNGPRMAACLKRLGVVGMCVESFDGFTQPVADDGTVEVLVGPYMPPT